MTPCSAASATTASLASLLLRYSTGTVYVRICVGVGFATNWTVIVHPHATERSELVLYENITLTISICLIVILRRVSQTRSPAFLQQSRSKNLVN